jgi:hypothetical protein
MAATKKRLEPDTKSGGQCLEDTADSVQRNHLTLPTKPWQPLKSVPDAFASYEPQ